MGSRLLKANACVRASGATNGRRKGGGGGGRECPSPKKDKTQGLLSYCVCSGVQTEAGASQLLCCVSCA